MVKFSFLSIAFCVFLCSCESGFQDEFPTTTVVNVKNFEGKSIPNHTLKVEVDTPTFATFDVLTDTIGNATVSYTLRHSDSYASVVTISAQENNQLVPLNLISHRVLNTITPTIVMDSLVPIKLHLIKKGTKVIDIDLKGYFLNEYPNRSSSYFLKFNKPNVTTLDTILDVKVLKNNITTIYHSLGTDYVNNAKSLPNNTYTIKF